MMGLRSSQFSDNADPADRGGAADPADREGAADPADREGAADPADRGGDDPFSKWSWDNGRGDYVREDDPLPEEALEVINSAPPSKLSPAEFEQIVPPEMFTKGAAKLLSTIGDVAKLESMKVDADDYAFSKAMAVSYQRLLDGPLSRLLALFSNRDLVDLVIVGAFVGPYSLSVAKEIRNKKKTALAQKRAAQDNGQDQSGPGPGDNIDGGVKDE